MITPTQNKTQHNAILCKSELLPWWCYATYSGSPSLSSELIIWGPWSRKKIHLDAIFLQQTCDCTRAHSAPPPQWEHVSPLGNFLYILAPHTGTMWGYKLSSLLGFPLSLYSWPPLTSWPVGRCAAHWRASRPWSLKLLNHIILYRTQLLLERSHIG